MNGTLASEVMSLIMDGKILPAFFKLVIGIFPFALVIVLGLILIGLYIWSQDYLLPTVTLLVYVSIANLSIVPENIRIAMLPPEARPVLYGLSALAITALLVNLFIRGKYG